MAGEHCARFDKRARITSVHRVYGDYIGFACRWYRDPSPEFYHYRRAVVVRARG
jgi:hypothetical protein